MALADVLLQVKADTNQARQELNKFASDLNNLAKGLKTVFSDVINVKLVTPKADIEAIKQVQIKANNEVIQATKTGIIEVTNVQKQLNQEIKDIKKKYNQEEKDFNEKVANDIKAVKKNVAKELQDDVINKIKESQKEQLKVIGSKREAEIKQINELKELNLQALKIQAEQKKQEENKVSQFQKTLALDLKKTNEKDNADKKALDEKRLNEQKALEIKLTNELKALNAQVKKENSELAKKLEADIAQAQKNQIAIKKQLEDKARQDKSIADKKQQDEIDFYVKEGLKTKKQLEEKARLEKLDAEKKALEQQKEAERRAAQPEKDYKANLSEQRQALAEANSIIHGFKNALNGLQNAFSLFIVDNPFIEFSKEFEKNMYNMNSIALETTENFNKLKSEIIGIAKEAQYSSLAGLSDSLYQAVSSGFKGSDATKLVAVAEEGAIAGLTDNKLVLEALTAVIHTYGLTVDDAAKINNIFLKTVQDGVITMPQLTRYIGQATTLAPELKINLQSVTSALAAMTLQGLSAAESTTALNQIFKTFLDPSKEASIYAKELGVNLSATAFEGRNLAEVIIELTSKADMDVLGKIFGNQRAIKGFFKLAKEDGQAFKDLYDRQMNNVVDNVKLAKEEQEKSFIRMLGQFGTAFSIAMQEVGQMFADGLMPILETLKSFIDAWNDIEESGGFFSLLKEIIKNLVIFNFTVGVTLSVLGSLALLFGTLYVAWNKFVVGATVGTLALPGAGQAILIFIGIAMGISTAIALWKEFWEWVEHKPEMDEQLTDNLTAQANILQDIIRLEKERIELQKQGKNLPEEKAKQLKDSYLLASATSTSSYFKSKMKGKEASFDSETQKLADDEKANLESLNKKIEAYKNYVTDIESIKSQYTKSLNEAEKAEIIKANLRWDNNKKTLEDASSSINLTDEQRYENDELLSKLEEARQADLEKIRNDYREKEKQADDKIQADKKKLKDDALKSLIKNENEKINAIKISIEKIKQYNEENSLSKQKSNNFLAQGFKLEGTLYKGNIALAKQYRDTSKAIADGFGDIPEVKEAINQAEVVETGIAKDKEETRKLDIEDTIKAIKIKHELKTKSDKEDAKALKEVEAKTIKDSIILNRKYVSDLNKILEGKSGVKLTGRDEAQIKKIEAEKIRIQDEIDASELAFNELEKKQKIDDIKLNYQQENDIINRLEKEKTITIIEANRLRLKTIEKQIIDSEEKIGNLVENNQAEFNGIQSEAYKTELAELYKLGQAKKDLEFSINDEITKSIINTNTKRIEIEKAGINELISLYTKAMNEIETFGNNLMNSNNGLVSTFGSLVSIIGKSNKQAVDLYSTLSTLPNIESLKDADAGFSVANLDNEFKTLSAVAPVVLQQIGNSLIINIENTTLFSEKVKQLNNILANNSINSKEAQTSLKGINESISDNMKAIPGFGDMLSKLTRQVTNFLGVTDSEKTKAKNKTMLDLEYQLLSDRLKINNEYISNARLVLDKEFIQKKESLKKQGLEVEEFNARLELLELEYYANSYKIKNEQEQKLISLTDEYQKLTLSMNDSYFNKLEASNLEYIADEYEIWSQRIDGLISLAEAEQQILNAQLAKEIRDNQIIQAEKVKEYNIIFELEKAKLNVQEDNLNKSLELASLEREKKLWELNQEYLQKAITEAQGEKKLKTINLEYNSEIEKINKESKKKIQDINEKNYKEELKIIDKVYGEKRKKLQQEVDKETDIIKKAQDERLKLQENREIDQARKEKLYNAFTTDLAKKKSILTASFYTMNEEEASKGNVKILDADGLEKQFKGFETVRNAVLNDFETTSMTVDERNKQLTQNALEAFSYYQNLLNLETDPNKRVAIQETLNKYQKDYYEYSTDKEKDKIDEEEKQASKRLDMKQKELDTAYDLEQEQINNLNKLYLDSANVYKTAFVEASREWLAGVKNGLLSNDLQAQSEVIQAANNLFQNKTEAQKYIGSSSTNSSYPSAYTTSNYPSTNTTSSTPTSSGTSSTSTNVTIPSYTLSSLDTDQRKALLIKYLAQNDPTHTEQYYFDKYFYYDLPTLKSIVQERGVSYLIPQFDQFKDGGVANKPSIFGEAGAEAAFNYPQMVRMYDYIIKTTGNPINNSSTVINMGGIHIQGTNLADAELVASAVNREFRNFENNIRRSK